MQSLSRMLNRLADWIPAGSQIAYLDYPLHFNVGDLLINLGTEAFFSRQRYRVRLRMSLFDLCHLDWAQPERTSLKEAARKRLAALDPATVLVLHGGGNFGDIYPEFQVMRERVVAAFPGRRIVILPQSLHFLSQAREALSLKRLLQHPDLLICVRDHASLSALQRHRADAGLLLPDMAHALWDTPGWHGQRPGSSDSLVLRRRDSESAGAVQANGSDTLLDWPDLLRRSDQIPFRLIRKAMAMDLDPSCRLPAAAWYRVRDRVVARAVRLFNAHGQVHTDRLHGMLLAAVLARPVHYSDNSYGKLSRYAQAWLGGSPLVRRCTQVTSANAVGA